MTKPTINSFHLSALFLFINLYVSNIYGQLITPISSYHRQLIQLNAQNKLHFNPLVTSLGTEQHLGKSPVKKSSKYQINTSELEHILDSRPQYFEQKINIAGIETSIGLMEVDVFVPGHQFVLSSEENLFVDKSKLATYRGYVIGDTESWVTLTIADGHAQFLIATKNGNYEILPQKDGTYLGFYSKDVINPPQFEDATPEDSYKPIRLDMEKGDRTGNCIQVYIETDYSVFQSLGGSVASWITSQMNNVTAVYAINDVQMLVASPTLIWNTTDPYLSASNVGTVRDAFVNYRQNNYTGRIAHLLSLRPLGGGIANGIGGYCNSYPTYPGPQCVSTQLTSSVTPFPTYSFDTYVICHEMGHVMGLRHTHACVWNNNQTQVDDCGNVYANNTSSTPEGLSCFNPSSPILPAGGGSIMSNCNLLPGTGINLNVGFGAVVGAELRQNFIYAPCNTGNCTGIPPTNDNCVDAIILPLRRDCIQYNFGIDNASVSNPAVSSFTTGCANNPNSLPNLNDVWFKVKPQSTSLTIESFQVASGPTDLIAQAYVGTSCSTGMTRIGCHDNKTTTDKHFRLVLTGLNVNDTVKIRIVSKAGFTGSFNLCAYDATLPCHPDIAPLLDLYSFTNGASWTNKTGWQQGAAGTNCDVCSWYGVTCNNNNRVTSISLPNNNLGGTSFPTSINNLTFLNTLKLNGNNIMAPLPASITLTYLTTLDLGQNKFSGTIPDAYGNITSLKNLYLDNNLLTGSLPTGLTNNSLSLIYVHNNNLSGCYPTSYSEYCSKAYNFSGNTLLANGVSFANFCTNMDGIDADGDTFCKAGLDCNDNDPAIKPGAVELCDMIDNNCNGLVDDVSAPQLNTWIGGTGNWNTASNWSLGVVPSRCTDVVINGTTGSNITIPAGFTALARSITVNSGRTLTVSATSMLKIEFGLNIINSGTINNLGTIDIISILNNTLYGLHNFGSFTNGTNAQLNIYSSGTRSMQNMAGGIINNNGFIVIDGNAFSQASNGIFNEGTINNYKEITVQNLTGTEVITKPNAGFINHNNSILRVRN
jgi:Leucine-rich repeat (LRR) protein